MIVPVKKEKAVDSAFADSLYFASGAFTRAVEKLANECWSPSGLTPSQGTLLLHLIYNDYAFPHFISSDLRVNPSSVTRLADQLEAKELIERLTYKRLTYLSATNKAEDLLPVLTKCDDDFLERCDQLLGKGNTSIVAGFLNRATDKLTVKKERKTK